MSKTRRKFSPEEQLSILQEGDREGQSSTCRKYNLGSVTLLTMEEEIPGTGAEGFKARLPPY